MVIISNRDGIYESLCQGNMIDGDYLKIETVDIMNLDDLHKSSYLYEQVTDDFE